MNNKIRKEMTAKDGTHLVVIKDNEKFWWFNFHKKNRLFGNSDGDGNAAEYLEEVRRFLG
jgi:hypothetical protein